MAARIGAAGSELEVREPAVAARSDRPALALSARASRGARRDPCGAFRPLGRGIQSSPRRALSGTGGQPSFHAAKTGPGDPGRRHPLQRRFRRRNAADRNQVHRVHGARGQRSLDPAGLPGRDPRARRHPRGRLGLPDPFLVGGHPHAGRPARRAGRAQPRRAAREHPRPARERHADREQRRLQRQEPEARRLRARSAARAAQPLPAWSRSR